MTALPSVMLFVVYVLPSIVTVILPVASTGISTVTVALPPALASVIVTFISVSYFGIVIVALVVMVLFPSV